MDDFPQPSPRAFGHDPATLRRLFGTSDDVLPLWVAEPDVPLADPIVQALRDRAATGWYGYESRPDDLGDHFWSWANRRHRWQRGDLHTVVSPSIGTSIGVLLEAQTLPGDGVILQPPVFTDFKPLVASAGRRVVKNPLRRAGEQYALDLDHLASVAAEPTTTAMVLCNPHNPVGRVWTHDELQAVATTCAEHDVFVIADEIHADLALGEATTVPFATVTPGTGLRWAALHGPIKTFGLAGVCDTLLVTDADDVVSAFKQRSSQLHLTRNNVFALAAFEAAYRHGDRWLDDFLRQVSQNLDVLAEGLPDPLRLVRPEGTYLAWIDLSDLAIDPPDLAGWLAREAGIALSPGHWFGREGAGFARMTVGVPTATIERALDGLAGAVARS